MLRPWVACFTNPIFRANLTSQSCSSRSAMNLAAAGLRSCICRRLYFRQVARACTAQSVHQQATTVEAEPQSISRRFQLRGYQEHCVETTLQGFLDEGCNRQLLALPTGAGKTVVFCEIAKRLNLKTLIITNRQELLDQTERTLEFVWPEAFDNVGRYQGRKRRIDRQIVITTVQTASHPENLSTFAAQDWELLIIDEAHHAPADSYVALMVQCGFLTTEEGDRVKAASKRGSSAHMVMRTNGSALGDATAALDTAEIPTGNIGSSIKSSAGSSAGDDGEATGLGSSSHAADATSQPQQDPQLMNTAAALTAVTSGSSSGSELEDVQALSDQSGVEEQQGPGRRHDDGGGRRRLLLGVTATPYRLKGSELSVVFEQLAYSITIPDLIAGGYLCKISAQRVLTYQDLSALPSDTTGDDAEGDFDVAELSKVVDTPARNRLIVDTYKKQALGRKAVAFCCDVKHAQNLTAAFNEGGVKAACLTGRNKASDRAAIIARHKAGEFDVLVNVSILTEGYDDTSINCVLMTRPTKSTGLYTQCVGRGLRVHPGKEDCLVLDFTDRYHSLDEASDLVTSEVVFEPGEGVSLIGYQPPVREELQRELKELSGGGTFELYSRQTFAWIPHGNDFWLPVWIGKTQKTIWFWLQRVDEAAADVDKLRVQERERRKKAASLAAQSEAAVAPAAVAKQVEKQATPLQEASGALQGVAKQAKSRRSQGLWYRLRVAEMEPRTLDLPDEPAPALALEILRQRQKQEEDTGRSLSSIAMAVFGGFGSNGAGDSDSGNSSDVPWDERWQLLIPGKYYGPVGEEQRSKAVRDADKVVKMAGARKHMGWITTAQLKEVEQGSTRRRSAASPKQCHLLTSLPGYFTSLDDLPSDLTKGQAGDMINLYEIDAAHKRLRKQSFQSLDDIFAQRRASKKQLAYVKNLLRAHGPSQAQILKDSNLPATVEEVDETLSSRDASRIIDRLKPLDDQGRQSSTSSYGSRFSKRLYAHEIVA